MPPQSTTRSRDTNAFIEFLQEAQREPPDEDVFEFYSHRFSSDHARRCVRQLYKTTSLRRAFGRLLGFQGIWVGMRISTLHKVISLRCEQEVVHYLSHIHQVWLRIVAGDPQALSRIDSATVEAVELRCPRFSTRDSEELDTLFERGQIFATFAPAERRGIREALQALDYLVPSLFTFFEDVKLLQMWADSMRHFVAPGAQAMRVLGILRLRPAADMQVRRLWVGAMRDWRRLQPPSRRSSDRLLAKVSPEKADEETVVRLACLADRQGFRSPEIADLVRRAPGGVPTEQGAHEDDASRSEESEDDESRRRNLDEVAAALVTSLANPRPRRCGLPTQATYEDIRKWIHPRYLHLDYSTLEVRGPEITPFFALRSAYIAFFGHPGEPAEHLARPSPSDTGSVQYTQRGQNIAPILSAEPSGPDSALGEQVMGQMRQQRDEVDDDDGDNGDGSSCIYVRVSENSREVGSHGLAVDMNAWTDEVVTDEDEVPPPTHLAPVIFAAFRGGHLEVVRRELVNRSNPSVVEDIAKRFMQRDRLIPFSTRLWALSPSQCLESAIDSGFNTIILLPQSRFHITRALENAVAQLRSELEAA